MAYPQPRPHNPTGGGPRHNPQPAPGQTPPIFNRGGMRRVITTKVPRRVVRGDF